MHPGMPVNGMSQLNNGALEKMNELKSGQAGSERNLRNVSQKFETAFTSALLKEQLKSAFSMDGENQAAGSGTYVNFAAERIARYIGRQNILGLSEMLTEELQAKKTEGGNGNG